MDKLIIGEYGKVIHLNATESLHKRLMDMGLVEGTTVKCIGVSPMGDPKAYIIRGAVIAIRNRDSAGITVSKATEVIADG